MATTEKGIRCRADAQTFCRGGLNECFPFSKIDAQRFFRIGVLARIQCAQTNLDMGFRDGEVDDDFDLGVIEQILDCSSRKAELIRPSLGGFGVHIRQSSNVQNGKRCHGFEIGAGDISAANDTDADRLHMISSRKSNKRTCCFVSSCNVKVRCKSAEWPFIYEIKRIFSGHPNCLAPVTSLYQ